MRKALLAALSAALVLALARPAQASEGRYFTKQITISVSDALAFTWGGPDGNIWFTEFTGHFVGRVTPRGSVREYALAPPANGSTLGNGPGEIKTGPGGDLWFAEAFGNKIGSVDPRTGAVREYPVPSGTTSQLGFYTSEPNGIAPGCDGDIWFSELATGKIGRLNPATGVITEFPVRSGADPHEMINGPHCRIWFTEPDANAVGYITPDGQITEFPLPAPPRSLPTSRPASIDVGSDGNIWFTERDANRIGRITPSGQVNEYPVPSTGGPDDVGELAAGPDGNIWFTEQRSNCVGRITPSGRVNLFAFPDSDRNPGFMTSGPDHQIWMDTWVYESPPPTNIIDRLNPWPPPAARIPCTHPGP